MQLLLNAIETFKANVVLVLGQASATMFNSNISNLLCTVASQGMHMCFSPVDNSTFISHSVNSSFRRLLYIMFQFDDSSLIAESISKYNISQT